MSEAKKARKLTPKQMHFARCVASGMSQTDAYCEAYNVQTASKRKTAAEEGSRLARDPDISARISRLIKQKDEAVAVSAVHDRDRVLRKLRDLLENATGEPAENVMLRAADLLGKSVGLYKDVQVQEDLRSPADIEAELMGVLARLSGTRQEQDDPDNPAVH